LLILIQGKTNAFAPISFTVVCLLSIYIVVWTLFGNLKMGFRLFFLFKFYPMKFFNSDKVKHFIMLLLQI